MTQTEGESLPSDPIALGGALRPLLMDQTDGRLRDIEWFRTPWQRSTALTAHATWAPECGEPVSAFVKAPVDATELRWTTLLGVKTHAEDPNACVPGVIASGTSLGAHDVRWMVLEQLDGKTLGAFPEKEGWLAFFDAAARFQRVAYDAEPPTRAAAPPRTDWADLIEKARRAARDNHIPEQQRWNLAIQSVQRRLDELVARWRSRDIDTWCHGDLHPGNAMMHETSSGPGCVLLDLGLVHAGSWIEDAIYTERLYWGRKAALCGVKPLGTMAKKRRELGLSVADDYAEFANLRRLLTASCAPAFLSHEGHPAYLSAAVDTIERTLPLV